MCVCESISVCVSGHKMTAPMQWQQLQFVRACPRGKKQAKEAAAGRVWLQLALALALWSSLQLVVRLVGHIYVRVQWAAFGLLYFQFLPLSAFAALRASLKGGRMQPQSNNSSRAAGAALPTTFHPCPAPPAMLANLQLGNETKRCEQKVEIKRFFKTPFAASLKLVPGSCPSSLVSTVSSSSSTASVSQLLFHQVCVLFSSLFFYFFGYFFSGLPPC